jgi:hypothetical protein
MFLVFGKVLTKENGLPIPNLVVAAFDYDPPEAGPPISPIELSSHSLDRLGSTLTDEQGAFTIQFDANLFLDGQQEEARPDILIAVYPPEEPSSDDEGAPDDSIPRPLFFSLRSVRIRSGLQEAFMVRISQQILNEHELLPASSTGNEAYLERLKTKLINANERTTAVKQLLSDISQEKRETVFNRKEAANAAFRNFTLSQLPRQNILYWRDGNSLRRLLERRNQNLFENLHEAENATDTPSQDLRMMNISLPSERVNAIFDNVEIDTDAGRFAGEIDISDAVSGVINDSLRSRASILRQCQEEAEARRIEDSADSDEAPDMPPSTEDESTTNGEASPSADETVTVENLEALLAQRLAHLMQSSSSPETELSYGIPREQDALVSVHDSIDNFKLKGDSPADGTAYHDFQRLDIAFEDVWTEVFDESIEQLGKEVWQEHAKLDMEQSEVRDISDMRNLLEQYRKDMALSSEFTVVPPNLLDALPDFSAEDDWVSFSDADREALTELASGEPVRFRVAGNTVTTPTWEAWRNDVLERWLAARQRAEERDKRINRIVANLDQALSEPHAFTIYAPESVNLGILYTYRQKWVPGNYQVGKLLKTVPLAPKEIRRYSSKQTVKEKRIEKEIRDSQSTRRFESETTKRAETEAIKRAQERTSFQQTIEGSFNIGGIGQIGGQTNIQHETGKESEKTKKNFREAVLKNLEEFKQQHRLEVETTADFTTESVDSGEIQNPNEELTVTYLFYELQRQYQISERIHQATPVVMVAFDVPPPHEINETWLMRHAWILRRVILDDSFLPALDFLLNSSIGDEISMDALRRNMERQAEIVNELIADQQEARAMAKAAFERMENLAEMEGLTADSEGFKAMTEALTFGPLGAFMNRRRKKAAERAEEVAEAALERADQEEEEVTVRLSQESAELEKAVNAYVKAAKEFHNRQLAVTNLRIHVKDNILYYMQRIIEHENPDQRYFRLANVTTEWVSMPDFEGARLVVTEADGGDITIPGFVQGAIHLPAPAPEEVERRKHEVKLYQAADLDNLLGFKGNYMIFPAKQTHYLHLYMMQEYVDFRTGGLRDADTLGNYSIEEIIEYLRCIRRSRSAEVYRQEKERLGPVIRQLQASGLEPETVVVPTDSLFIEALPGSHPLLEDFKLVHRALDVKKVQAEVRRQELENIRLASRLAAGDREDPDIDTNIQIEGDDAPDIDIET